TCWCGRCGVAECVANGFARIVGIVPGRSIPTGAVDQHHGQCRIAEVRTIGAVTGISQEIALVGEDRFVLAILQRIYSGPTITAATAGKLQVNAVAATVGGRAGSDLRGIPLEVFAGDDVYHAGNCVGAVDRRSTAGQDLDALNDRGRNGAHVDHVVVAV